MPQLRETCASSSSQVEGLMHNTKFEEIWEQYNQVLKVSEPQLLKTLVQEKVQDTSKSLEKILITTKSVEKPLGDQDIEVILAFPTSEVLLRVE